jgi:antitoxin (DNA-binding transcriptional repressor) of toxin-antitoxin stability system
MSSYSIADAKAGLPGLINRALAGEEVIITRHGKPVAELRAAHTAPPRRDAEALNRLLAGRLTLPQGAPSSVEILNQIYDESDY